MGKNIDNTIVSVCVITYNSANTVIETLNSIKAQTYQNIELIISDDCSKDDTVAICHEWVAKNGARFMRTEIITVETNTGVAGNCNRAESVCEGEWVKIIAGDDIMLPSCIQDYMQYVSEHPDTEYLFSRQKAFGADEKYCQEIEGYFDYSFFERTIEEQLHRLVFDRNCIPAPTAFYRVNKVRELGLKFDERIPLLEDWPRWINLLRAGIKFRFLDKELVKYRVGGISTVQKLQSPRVYRSERLLYFLYLFPERYKQDPDGTIKEILDEECKEYNLYYSQSNSWALKIGIGIMKPVRAIMKMLGI